MNTSPLDLAAEIAHLQAELDRVNAAAAEMRGYLQSALKYIEAGKELPPSVTGEQVAGVAKALKRAISNDAGVPLPATLNPESFNAPAEAVAYLHANRYLPKETEDAVKQLVVCAVENREQIKDLTELERVNQSSTEMRAVLLSLVNERIACADGKPATHAWLDPDSRERILHALSTTVGSDYVKREDVKVLVDMLKAAWIACECGYIIGDKRPRECGECGSIAAHSIHCFQGKLEAAIAHAKQKGLL